MNPHLKTRLRCDSKLTPKYPMIILIPICVFVSIPLMAQSGSIPISSGWDRSRCDDLPVKNQGQKPRAWWRCFKSPSPSNSESYQERLEKGLEITPRLLQGSRNRSYHVGNVLAVVSHPIAVYLQYPHLPCRLSGHKVSKNEEVVTSAVIAAIRSCERLPRWLQHGTEMWPFLVVNLPLLSIKPQVSVSQGQYDKHISSIFKCGHTNTQYQTIISVIQITSYNTLTCSTQPSRQIYRFRWLVARPPKTSWDAPPRGWKIEDVQMVRTRSMAMAGTTWIYFFRDPKKIPFRFPKKSSTVDLDLVDFPCPIWKIEHQTHPKFPVRFPWFQASVDIVLQHTQRLSGAAILSFKGWTDQPYSIFQWYI